MLYTRSSFIKYLTDKLDCEIIPLKSSVILVKFGPATAYIHLNKKDVIDYEEIYIACRKLWVDLPGDSDLVKVE